MFALAAGCSAPATPASTAHVTVGQSGPPPTAAAQADAVSTAKRLLETPGFSWVGSPQPVRVEQTTYAGAARLIGLGEPDYAILPAETPVWFVIFKGSWDLMPMGPPEVALTPVRYEGCILITFSVKDGKLIQVADAVCPGQ